MTMGICGLSAEGITVDQALEKNIKDFVRTRLAAHEYPRKIEFVNQLPLTATGKIIRKELRQRDAENSG